MGFVLENITTRDFAQYFNNSSNPHPGLILHQPQKDEKAKLTLARFECKAQRTRTNNKTFLPKNLKTNSLPSASLPG